MSDQFNGAQTRVKKKSISNLLKIINTTKYLDERPTLTEQRLKNKRKAAYFVHRIIFTRFSKKKEHIQYAHCIAYE